MEEQDKVVEAAETLVDEVSEAANTSEDEVPEAAAKTIEDEVSEAAAKTFEDEVCDAADKFEEEFEASKVETMIHRFPAGLGEIRSRYPCMVVPRFVAVGPYHHGEKHLDKMEPVKKAAARYFFQWNDPLEADVVKKKFLTDREDGRGSVVDEARAKYFPDKTGTEKGMMKGNDQFAEMMICDACFLLMYMLACNNSYGKGIHSHHGVNESMRRFLFSNRDSIDNDIMLLENQLPWPVIQFLIDQVPSDKKEKLKEAVGRFIADMGSSFKIRQSSKRKTYSWWEDEDPPPHLLALLRRYKTNKNPDGTHTSAQAAAAAGGGGCCCCVVSVPHDDIEKNSSHSPTPSKPSTQEGNPKAEVVISAISPTNLTEIGIVLTASKTAAFSDMGLEKGWIRSELTLAPLSLDDRRASCLVNMAAFEVCIASRYGDPPENTAVCSYLALLAFFMVGSEDVRKLRSMGLLNGPGSDADMLAFFMTLIKHLPDYGTHFAIVMKGIEEYRTSRPIRTTLYKWIYNYFLTIIKMVTVLTALIGLYKAFLSLVHENKL